jgi:hypothetical protein
MNGHPRCGNVMIPALALAVMPAGRLGSSGYSDRSSAAGSCTSPS